MNDHPNVEPVSEGELKAEQTIKDKLPSNPVYFYAHHQVAEIIALNTRARDLSGTFQTAEYFKKEFENALKVATERLEMANQHYNRAIAAEAKLAIYETSLKLADDLAAFIKGSPNSSLGLIGLAHELQESRQPPQPNTEGKG